MIPPTPNLPVTEILEDLKSGFTQHHELILLAPPGAGKTTLVPLALASEPWLGDKKILMLEPRRIAARAAAGRLAELLGETVGQTVGYRMRLDTKISNFTKIEVITEGILTRMLQEDPSLADVGLVIFDEFHERSLNADLALALCLKGRELLRQDDPLKVLVMSATLDSSKLTEMLDAPLIRSDGKQFPVDIVYGKASQPRDSIVDKTVTAILHALTDNPQSSQLVFLPGQGEIRRVEENLAFELQGRSITGVHIKPLYGHLTLAEQREAIAPLPDQSERKVVLATNIAETSLTIEGVDVVIDSGLAREPVFDPSTALTRLQTKKISQASSIQRAGRAGRLRPGKCYRLWSSNQQEQMAAHSTPEILNADLAPVALELLRWGISDPEELMWLDNPGRGQWQQSIALLATLGAVEQSGGRVMLTESGTQLSQLAVHPRIAHMLICGHAIGHTQTACLIASLLSDRDPFGHDQPDLQDRLDILSGRKKCPNQQRGWFHRTQQLAEQFAAQVKQLNIKSASYPIEEHDLVGYLVACAYPDRIARQRHSGGFQLANGRGASMNGSGALQNARWLAVADIGGKARSKGDTIRLAAILDESLFESLLMDQVIDQLVVEWDKKTKRFVAEERTQVGALVLNKRKLDKVPVEAKVNALIEHVRTSGLEVLSMTPGLRQWQARVELVRTTLKDADWPAVSDEHLLGSLEDWLGAYLEPVNLLSDFKKLDIQSMLLSRLDWAQQQKLNELAPQRWKVASGASFAIDYTVTPPVLAVKLQEMFGCDETPAIINGQVALMVHLLSPAGRPIQITQDLAGFWKTSYLEVKKEMKGRYPKHTW